MDPPLIYLIAGEASGDVLGGRLMAALLARRPGLRFAGIGGERMAEHGLTSRFPMRELALMGLLEILPNVIALRQRLGETVADIAACRPAVVVTIDSPGFTLRVLRAIAPLGVPRAQYVAPQVWAWRPRRVRHYGGLWEKLLCLLPFEPAFFARHHLPATFVGHPVLESGAGVGDAVRFRARHGLAPDTPVLTVMPGSRRTEVTRMLPVFEAALRLVAARVPGLVPVVPLAGPVAGSVAAATRHWPTRPILLDTAADKHDGFAASAAALTKSGTSTLELAMAGVPMLVSQRANPVSVAIMRRTVTVRYLSILNLIAEREIVPELLQEACTPQHIAAALVPLLTDPAAAAAQRSACRAVLAQLAPLQGTPSDAAAAEVMALLDGAPMVDPAR